MGQLRGIYPAAYEVAAIHWQDRHHLLLADLEGAHHKLNIYRLRLVGI
jgi:hypothetical protein